MPTPINLTIAAGASVSSEFFLSRSDRETMVYCSSHAAVGFSLQYAPASGSAAFQPVFNETGVLMVFSSNQGAWGMIKSNPSAWARISCSSQLISATSFMVLVARGNP
jgi:hypothetical protein